MAIDTLAFVSAGAYATPGSTTAERAALFASWGLLDAAPEPSAPEAVADTLLGHIGRWNPYRRMVSFLKGVFG